MKFDLDSLEVLEAIVEEGTFAGAARRLHRTQSAVSYSVAKLEEGLGVAVFDRRGHRARLTTTGRVVLDEGRALLHRGRRLQSLVSQLEQGWEARLEVIIDGILPMDPILGVLREFAAETVPTRVQVKMEFLGGVQYRFDADGADLMVVKDYEPAAHLRATALGSVEVVLLCGADHPLASVDPGDPVDRPGLQEFVELTIQDSSPGARYDARIFGGPRVFFLSDFHAKKAALLAGLGFGWMPMDMVSGELGRGELVEVPYLEGSRYEFQPAAVHRTDRALGPAGQRFLRSLQDAFRR